MNVTDENMDRLTALLIDEAAFGLDQEELQELDTLLPRESQTDRDEFMALAGLVQTAFVLKDASGAEGMPADLKQRIGARQMSTRAANEPVPETPQHGDVVELAPGRGERRNLTQWSGWLLAAAIALVFVFSRPAVETGTTTVDLRLQLIADAADVTVVDFAPGDTDPFRNVSGDVVWSSEQQAGFLRLAGLPVNDPTVNQYQLWIVDPARDARPVDGGVFDITVDGEVVIAIDAKLAVATPAAFAITLEQPGGVVVSDGPLLVVAAVPEKSS